MGGEGQPLFSQYPGWERWHVLEAEDLLGKLPKEDQAGAEQLLDQPGIPPADAMGILKNLIQQAAPERREIFRLAESEDARDRSLAITRAVKLPPMPDPRVTLVREAVSFLRRAIKVSPGDPLAAELKGCLDSARSVLKRLRKQDRELRRLEAKSRS